MNTQGLLQDTQNKTSKYILQEAGLERRHSRGRATRDNTRGRMETTAALHGPAPTDQRGAWLMPRWNLPDVLHLGYLSEGKGALDRHCLLFPGSPQGRGAGGGGASDSERRHPPGPSACPQPADSAGSQNLMCAAAPLGTRVSGDTGPRAALPSGFGSDRISEQERTLRTTPCEPPSPPPKAPSLSGTISARPRLRRRYLLCSSSWR